MTKASTKSVWILDDDVGVRFVYQEVLGNRFSLRMHNSLRELADSLSDLKSGAISAPSLMLADLRLPDGIFLDRIQFEPFQSFFSQNIPFVVVSSTDDVEILRKSFDLGAEDYLTKPFKGSNLLVKTERILNKASLPKETLPSLHSNETLSIDSVTLTIAIGENRSQSLTSKEFQIVSLLNQARFNSINRDELMTRIWGSVKVSTKSLDVHLFNLRRKLATLGVEVLFVSPGSYKLVVAQPIQAPESSFTSASGQR